MQMLKESDVDIIGCVPQHWRRRRLKYLCRIQTGNQDTQNATPDGQYPFYVRSPIPERSKRYTFDGEGILVAGDGAGAGRVFHHVFGKYAVHQRVYRLSDFSFHSRFLYYWLSLLFPFEMDKGSAQSTVPSMRLPMLLNFPVFLPSIEEARAITEFLDNKLEEIELLEQNINAEIATLGEYKDSIITKTVTKGVNFAQKMKDSNIPWIGEFPAHWEQHPIYFYYTERKAPNILLQEKNLLSLSYGKIKQKDINTNGGLLPSSFSTYNIIEKWDIVIRPTDLQNDQKSLRTAIAKERGIITSAYISMRPKDISYAAYHHYLLHVYDKKKVFYNMGNGVRQGLNYAEFSKLMLLTPPPHERQIIVAYLDAKCSDIETIIKDMKSQLLILKEYKKSLIYEYITGKKEVPAL